MSDDREFEEGAGTRSNKRKDPLKEYYEKEPMTPAKIKEHEPTAVKREMSEHIVEPGQTGTNIEETAEKARRSGTTKETADTQYEEADTQYEEADTQYEETAATQYEDAGGGGGRNGY